MKPSFKVIFMIGHQKLHGEDVYIVTLSQSSFSFFVFYFKTETLEQISQGHEICE